jgi:hypothetical protein
MSKEKTSTKGKLLASTPESLGIEGVENMLNKMFYSTTFKVVEGIVSNSKGEVPRIEIQLKKGRYRIMFN